ncbi:hypothetical protein N7468_003110 [Penicillium chermesinum]|uniref:Isochorismatase-like domain-containing protein n=1 Tax=Penicillium chermesinum TaxID=63820 RepID=A0A9W9TRA8_9EURO|nr:uncharacterized protein N7468_003110 [Penicillium chermesinum]KAJ5238491.1 hypothetical protein N7468_003110 [Penicillium chermesinum]
MAALAHTIRIRNPALFICDIQEKFRNGIFEFSKLYKNPSSSLWPINKPIDFPPHQGLHVREDAPRCLHAPIARLCNDPKPRKARKHGPRTPDPSAGLAYPGRRRQDPILDGHAGNRRASSQGRGERLDIIIVGIETHICVAQTTLDLLARGHRVYLLVDGVSSMNAEERGIALARLRDAGAIVTSSESILFEILGDAEHGSFRTVSGLIKETKEETKAALGVFSKI